MEKTIRYFLLIMIITGTIFTYGCFHDDLFKEDVGTEVESEVVVVEVEDEGAAEEVVTTPEEPATSPQPVEEDIPVVEVEVTTEVEAEATVEESPAPEEPAAPVGEPAPVPAEQPAPAEQPVPTEEPAPAAEEPQSIYQDGVFNAQGNYFNPNGAASISVSLTLDNDVVTSLTVTPHATDETSVKFQNAVKDSASGLVVGKKLNEIGAFSKISTSSLTPNGFNQAIASIKASAKN